MTLGALKTHRYIEDRYIGVLSHTFYCNFCRDIAYLSLYRGYRYIEDRCIGVPLYMITGDTGLFQHTLHGSDYYIVIYLLKADRF